jgi:hypothetical protein
MATIDEGIKIATPEGRKLRMSAGRERGATARGAIGGGVGR